MKKGKDKLLGKLIQKDYNNKLEEVLSEKDFDEKTKSLLLDMLYKIEISYKDYSKIKKNVLSKEDYIKKLINLIRECEKIELISPNSDKEKLLEGKSFKIDKEEKVILAYPIERKVLYALAKMDKKEDIIRSKNELLNKTLTDLLNVGNNINVVEPLRDFNGFSWNIVSKDIENKYYNLIYQDLLFLVDNSMFEKWTNDNNIDLNYLQIFGDILNELYGIDLTNKLLEKLFEIAVLINLQIDKEGLNKFQERKEELEEEYNRIKNKEEYVNFVIEDNKKKNRRIRKIDSIINNKALLKDEYERQNSNLPLEKKIFSLRILTQMLKAEREELLKNIDENNISIKPEKYIEKCRKIENELKRYELLNESDIEARIYSEIIIFQKEIMEAFEKKIDNANDKEEIVEILYELRYYKLIPFQDGNSIGTNKELLNDFEHIERKIINKAIEMKVLTEVSKDKNINYYILKNIFELRIISLEDINFKIQKEKENLFLQFLDEKTNDERIKIERNLKKKDLNVRLNKKIKLFV